MLIDSCITDRSVVGNPAVVIYVLLCFANKITYREKKMSGRPRQLRAIFSLPTFCLRLGLSSDQRSSIIIKIDEVSHWS